MRLAVLGMIAAFLAIGTDLHAASTAPAEPWGMRPRDPIDLPAKEFFTAHLWAPMPGLGEAKGLALGDCKKAVDFAKAPYKITRAQQRISGPEMIVVGPKGEEARVTKISSDTILVEWPLGPRAYVACQRAATASPPKTEPAKPKAEDSSRKESGAPETPAPKTDEEAQTPPGQMPGEGKTGGTPPALQRETPPAQAPSVPKPADTRPPLQPEPYPLPPIVAPPARPPAQTTPPKTPGQVPSEPGKPSTGKPATPKDRGDGPVTELPKEAPLDPAAPGTNVPAPAPAMSPPTASPPPPAPPAAQPPAQPQTAPPAAAPKEPAGPPASGVPFVL